jgi:hypothetical protein
VRGKSTKLLKTCLMRADDEVSIKLSSVHICGDILIGRFLSFVSYRLGRIITAVRDTAVGKCSGSGGGLYSLREIRNTVWSPIA